MPVPNTNKKRGVIPTFAIKFRTHPKKNQLIELSSRR